MTITEEIREVKMNFDDKAVREIFFISKEGDTLAEVISFEPFADGETKN